MSANLLRNAAEKEREEWGGAENARRYPQSSAIHLALAEWLDDHALDHDCYECGWVNCQSVAVASAILGGAS